MKLTYALLLCFAAVAFAEEKSVLVKEPTPVAAEQHNHDAAFAVALEFKATTSKLSYVGVAGKRRCIRAFCLDAFDWTIKQAIDHQSLVSGNTREFKPFSIEFFLDTAILESSNGDEQDKWIRLRELCRKYGCVAYRRNDALFLICEVNGYFVGVSTDVARPLK